jgi:bifunctional polynucleotide phosphatase/kinase
MWSEIDTVYYKNARKTRSSRVIAFDLDDTLIKTKSGKKFPVDENDWEWWSSDVPLILRELSMNYVNLVIFTNQAGIKNHDDAKKIMHKIDQICLVLGFEMSAYIASKNDKYRKPNSTMWELFENGFLNEKKPIKSIASFCLYPGEYKPTGMLNVSRGMEIFFESCLSSGQCISSCHASEETIYVGDAAGRLSPKDFSDSDRKFAINCGIEFMTPEEFFNQEEIDSIPWDLRGLSPADLIAANSVASDLIPSKTQEMIIMVGLPASGKSTTARAIHDDAPGRYEVINMDTLKTLAKCKKMAAKYLNDGASVIIDNTNPGPESRAVWTQIAAKAGVPVRVMLIEPDYDLSAHLNAFRARTSDTPPIPKIAYNIFKKKYVTPSLDEPGINSVEVIKVKLDGSAKYFDHWGPQ